jgi:hypothetical protein
MHFFIPNSFIKLTFCTQKFNCYFKFSMNHSQIKQQTLMIFHKINETKTMFADIEGL